LGISVKRFSGWEPAETTTVVDRDDAGRPARWVTTRESEWDVQQQAEMLALALYRAGLCHRCGGELAETTSADNDRDNPHGVGVYKATRKVRCHKCTAAMESDHEHSSNKLVPFPAAVMHITELVPRGRR
jgi:hypothetical protein